MINPVRSFYMQVLPSIIGVFIFTASCGQHLKTGPMKNDMLPKEIHLPPQTVKIIDSIFVFENGIRQLETVQVFNLKDDILVSGHTEYYVKGILNFTAADRFDHNGNNIESKTTFHLKNSVQVFSKKLDDKGSIIQLTATENGKENIIYYKNRYSQDRLTEHSVISENTGRVIEKTAFQYDAHGNLAEEKVTAFHREAKNLYEYNKDNQVTLYQHIQNGELNDKVLYNYHEGLLRKTEAYDWLSPNPSIENYTYNKDRQLVMVRQGASNDKTEYKDFDEFGNWQIMEIHVYGELTRLTKRQFFIR